MQTLDVISVNLWQMLISLINLVLLFLIVRKFLYKPVKKMLRTRQQTIDGEYTAAQQAKTLALEEKEAYSQKLKQARNEADHMIKSAAETASLREKEILDKAKEQADRILRQAEADAVLERKKAEDGMKKEIAEISSLLTEKMLQREVTTEDHKRMIDSFLEDMGDGYDAD